VLTERAVAIIVEFVPILYNPDVLWQRARRSSVIPRLELWAIVSTRWISHEEVGRQAADATLSLGSKCRDMNEAIRNWLSAGKRVWARRMRREPRRS